MRTHQLKFVPLTGLTSGHLQTITSLCIPKGGSPPSTSWLVELQDGDRLCCEISTPLNWNNNQVIVLVHGLGGSHASSYMIRLARKCYNRGFKVVRVNLRGCGTGRGLAKKTYHAGNSQDVLMVLKALKKDPLNKEIILVGFSLGGNLVLKLAGELESDANKLVKSFIAACPPIDLMYTVSLIEMKRYSFYRYYYLRQMYKQTNDWIPNKMILSFYEFDSLVTAPCWNFKGPYDYYESCSSLKFLSKIKQETHLLLAKDDPFICTKKIENHPLSPYIQVWFSNYGGHLGFLGKTNPEHASCWLDQLLLKWVEGDFASECL